MLHGLGASDTSCPRISLTFRLSAVASKQLGFVAPKKKLAVVSFANFHNVAFEDMFAEIKDSLQPDITTIFGKTYKNEGRMSSELMSESHWSNANQFVYKYGRKTHVGQKMGPLVSALLKQVEHATSQPMDWVHATYYPTGQTKLAQHSDDETTIAVGSDIACLTFMRDPGVTRDVFVKPKPKKRAQKTVSSVPDSKKPCARDQWFQVTWPK
jgi:hypothetical protein